MTEETQLAEYKENRPAKISMFDMEPEQQILFGARIATSLKDVIVQKKLSKKIGANEYPYVEAWQLCGQLLGVLPREKEIKEIEGGYEAHVELVRASDGRVISAASHICTREEHTWKNRDDFALRSMAVTRAVGKAYRISFSWIMSLAGYQGTPAEEMPHEDPRVETYSGSTEHQKRLEKILVKENVPEEKWPEVDEKMRRKEMTLTAIKTVLAEMQ